MSYSIIGFQLCKEISIWVSASLGISETDFPGFLTGKCLNNDMKIRLYSNDGTWVPGIIRVSLAPDNSQGIDVQLWK